MGKWGTGKVSKICEKCKIEFKARQDRLGKYCSKSCSSSAKPKRFLRIKKKCEVCLKEFIVKKYRKKTALYCSVICRRMRMPRQNSHPKWKGGIAERAYQIRKLINELIDQFKKCNECGNINDLQGHHIVPYSERPDLGACKDNIVILCKRCHANKHPKIKGFILKV